MRKNFPKILILSAAFVLLFFGLAGSVEAAACNQFNRFIISNSSIGWGDTPMDLRWTPISAAPAATVRLSLVGEDGCADQTGNFRTAI